MLWGKTVAPLVFADCTFSRYFLLLHLWLLPSNFIKQAHKLYNLFSTITLLSYILIVFNNIYVHMILYNFYHKPLNISCSIKISSYFKLNKLFEWKISCKNQGFEIYWRFVASWNIFLNIYIYIYIYIYYWKQLILMKWIWIGLHIFD